MSLQRFAGGSLQEIAADEIAVICGTDGIKRDGNDVCMSGMSLANFALNPVFQVEHVPPPIGAFVRLAVTSAREVGLNLPGEALAGVVRLAPAAISAYVAEKRGLIESGYYNAVSIGFQPEQVEPIDPREPWGGLRVLTSELYECSAVSVPADPVALIVARSFRAQSRTLRAMLRSLPAVSPAATARVMARAGRVPEAEAVPFHQLSTFEQMQTYRFGRAQHARAVSALGMASRAEERERHEWRRARVQELARRGGY